MEQALPFNCQTSPKQVMTDRLRLLCVDDEEHILHTLNRFCRNEGIEIRTATSPAEALTILENEPISIIISDYQMPHMNGLDLLEQVHLRWPHIIRIIISGFVSIPLISQAQQRGDIFAFMGKPWVREELKTLIENAFSHYKSCICGEKHLP
jgi:DNA-binding NtrC family response regulator